MQKKREDRWPEDDPSWSDESLYEAMMEHRRKFHRPLWDRQATVVA